MENKSIEINLNGVTFNVICSNNDELKKVKYVFDKMFACDYNLTSDSDTIFNLYLRINSEQYSEFNSRLLLEKSKFIKPNIYEYDYSNSKVYHHYSNFYVYSRDNNYYIVSNNKYAAYYVILEIYNKICEMNSFYLFHGNGIKIDNTPISIIGNSHSGKTTLMSKLVQIEGANKSFLSNDRILVGNNKTLYFPIDINLDINTVLHDECLSKKIDIKDKKIYVDPKTFVGYYPNLDYISHSNNYYFIIPKINLLSKRYIEVTTMSNEEALKILNYCCFSLEDKECLREDWIMKSENRLILEKKVNKLLADIIKRYKILLVEYGCDLQGEEIYEKIRKKN